MIYRLLDQHYPIPQSLCQNEVENCGIGKQWATSDCDFSFKRLLYFFSIFRKYKSKIMFHYLEYDDNKQFIRELTLEELDRYLILL